MTRGTVGVTVIAAAALTIGSLTVAARQNITPPRLPPDQKPGQPTIARMYILNHAASEAVPVTIQSPSDMLPVAITGVPTVRLDPESPLATHTARQNWEYRRIVVAAGVDPTGLLNAAGEDGWDAVGAVATSPSASMIILKRPR